MNGNVDVHTAIFTHKLSRSTMCSFTMVSRVEQVSTALHVYAYTIDRSGDTAVASELLVASFTAADWDYLISSAIHVNY